MIKLWTDATPKFASYVIESHNGIRYQSGPIALEEGTTVNQAEYMGLIYGLETIIRSDFADKTTAIYMDSELVVNQILGKYKVKNEGLLWLYKEAMYRIEQLPIGTTIQWIKGSTNIADKGSRPNENKG